MEQQHLPLGPSKNIMQCWFLIHINVPTAKLIEMTRDEDRFATTHLLTRQQAMILLTWVRKHRSGLRVCEACGSPHHQTSRSRQCPFDVPPSHPIVATTSSDRDMMNEINDLQRLGDEQLREAARNQHPPETCPTCGLPGHSRSSNPACPFRALSKKQFMASRLPASEDYTRIRSLDAIVRPTYRNVLITNIRAKSDYLRRTMTRLQLFLLDNATHHPDQVQPFLFTQDGFYLMTQLTHGHLNAFLERSDECMPDPVLTHWHEFNQDLINVATYDTPGHITVLSMACKLQASANRNHITENFEGRIKKFVKFRFAVDGEAPPSRSLATIKDYVYQNFAMVTRNMEPLPVEIPERHRPLTVLVLNDLWAMKPPQLPMITQETLRADPGRHLPILRTILDVYDHYRATNDDENDVEVPSFTLLPLPSSKPRFVDVTPENVISLTGSRQSPNNQVTRLPPFLPKLHVFWQVFAFEKLGYPSFESLHRAWIRGHFFSGVMRTDCLCPPTSWS
ncbi:hypothetical protein DM01DRAFT_1374306 [Hesseltinella vesiculosa]|uniref:Uncharacterized protein n=1 Tax=Hesseltinella vesiculosa TaxID=101127 RepID=A0A1X2GGR9_9FUNG|nr:hypothetical protein DM01DRAFT_1374306 [Hesseltinella vesiculosa]